MSNSIRAIPEIFLEKWQNMADLLAKVMDIPAALIMKTDNEYMEVFISSRSANNPYTPGDKEHWSGLYCETVIKTQHALKVPNALKDKNWDKNPDIKLGMIAYLGIPLNYPDKEAFGTICVLDNKENQFSNKYKELLYQFKNVIELDLALIQSLDWAKRNENADIINKLLEQNEEYLAINEELNESNIQLLEEKEKFAESEKALLNRHGLFDYIIKHDPYGIGVLDNNLHFIYVSERFLNDYHFDSREAVIGKHHYEVFPEIPEKWKEAHQRVLKGEIIKKNDDIYIRKDGTVEYTRWECRPWKHYDGSIGGIIVYTELITEQKKLLDSTRKAYDLIKNLAAQVPGVLYQYRLYPDGRSAFPFSSEGMYDIYELTSEEVKEDATPVLSRIHPDDIDYIVKSINESARDQTVYQSKFRVILPKQGLRWRQCNAQPELLEDGSTLWHGIIMDITDEKIKEDLLNEKSEEINTFFDCALDLLCIADLQGSFIRLNKEWENVLGYSLGELEGKKFIDFVHPDDLNATNQAINRLSNQEIVANFTNRFLCKNGSYRWIEWKSTPVGNHIYSAARDITNNIKTNEELIIAKEKAEESNRLKTEFLNNMSHEIRTPMNGIIGFSELLNEPDLSVEKRNYYSKIVQNSSVQLLKIIDDILEISTLETKQIKLYEESFCLNDLLMELFSIFDSDAKNRNIPLRLVKGASDKQSCIISDKTKLNKILGNLLENAFKYTNEGSIELGYSIKDEDLLLYVKDTGIGINPENREIIFERFAQEEKELSRSHNGLGLGLSISKENAQILGGEIIVESEKGKGSTFFVRLPYKQALPDALTEKRWQVNENLEPPTIIVLIAEDEEVNYLFLETLLKEEISRDYITIHARNGEEAVDICSQNDKIDIVLMDIEMPLMNGHEATKTIKSTKPDIKIIAQTAYSTEFDRELAFQAGCDDFITKPIDREKLFSTMNKHLIISE